MRAILIRSDQKTITETICNGLVGLNRLIGGVPEVAMRLDNDLVIGRFLLRRIVSDPRTYFMVAGLSRPFRFMGNGVLVGRANEHTWTDPHRSVEDMRAIIQFGMITDDTL